MIPAAMITFSDSLQSVPLHRHCKEPLQDCEDMLVCFNTSVLVLFQLDKCSVLTHGAHTLPPNPQYNSQAVAIES